MARLGNFDIALTRAGWFDIDAANPRNGWLDKVAVGVLGAPPPPPPTVLPLAGGGGGGGGRWPLEQPKPWPPPSLPIDLLDFEPAPDLPDLRDEPSRAPAPEEDAPEGPSDEDILGMVDTTQPADRVYVPGHWRWSGIRYEWVAEHWATASSSAPETPVRRWVSVPAVVSTRRDWFPYAMAFLGITTAVGIGVVIGRVTSDAEKEPKSDDDKRLELDQLLADLRRKGLLS